MRLGLVLLASLAGFALGRAPVPDSVYAAPQRLIAVDAARRLNLFCMGSGRPVVMLEAGSGNSMVTWRRVQAAAARTTRVCAYDRAGLGFSDAATRPSSDANAVDDLQRLLRAADIPLPIVFVGHSLGGEIGLLFAATYPNEVASAVLVDPGFPDMLRLLSAALPEGQRSALTDGFRRLIEANRACLVLAEAGALTDPATQATRDCVTPSGSSDKLDPALRQTAARQLALPRVWRAMISENECFMPEGDRPSVDGQAFANAHLSFDDKPLIVLTRGNQEGAPGVPAASVAAIEAAWKAGHDRIAALSARGVSKVVPNTGHYIQIDQPEAVIDAVRRVVDEVRE